MIEKSVASSDTGRTYRSRSREERGIFLFRERGDEIEYVKGWLWLVPSCSGYTHYLVNLAREHCECPDNPPVGEVCKHVAAATIARAKSSECAGCARKVRYRDLYEISDEHLTFFEGDALCESCAIAHGVL